MLGAMAVKGRVRGAAGGKMVCMKYLIALLAVAGVVVSAVALHIHNMDPAAAPPCAISAHFDCGLVGHSRYSVFPARTDDEKPGMVHIPVAAIGIAGYALIAIFAVMGRFRIVLELARIGFFCAVFLSYIEAYVIQMCVSTASGHRGSSPPFWWPAWLRCCCGDGGERRRWFRCCPST